MNIFSRIIFLFIFSTSITHAQVYYEDSVRYSLQNIVTSSLNEVNKFTEEDKNNISELESPNEPQTYNKIGQACQIDFYNSVWKNKKSVCGISAGMVKYFFRKYGTDTSQLAYRS